MPNLKFIAALYNEENELESLVHHVAPYVSAMYFADDGSTDHTVDILKSLPYRIMGPSIFHTVLDHTGLPETVKKAALDLVVGDWWVLMLDADERFAPGVLDQIKRWVYSSEAVDYTHVYFNQIEIIDEVPVRQFQKSKLFRKGAVRFSEGIHEDDQFEGKGLYKGDWMVYHRKTSQKQKQREQEYLETYDRLFEEGKIDEGRREWLRGLHHYDAP